MNWNHEQTGLPRAAATAAAAARLLVATDFDGTLSEIVEDPKRAVAHRRALEALRSLALSRDTAVVVISGRGVADLRSRVPHREIAVVGGHGAEFETDLFLRPSGSAEALERARGWIGGLTRGLPGSFIEHKPLSMALHFRSESGVSEAMVALRRYADAEPALVLREGKRVAELCLRGPDKGDAYRAFRAAVDAGVFIGDDSTDEAVFGAMPAGDVGAKVGPEATRAAHRLAGVPEVAAFLRLLAQKRAGLQQTQLAEVRDRLVERT